LTAAVHIDIAGILAPMSEPAVVGRTASGIAYEVGGSGPPIVLVHAGVADRRMWDPQWTAFQTGHRVVRYDARGYGESLPPLGAWSQHGDLLGLLDELGLARVHLVGASMGAGIAVEAALARPEAVASLVLAAPGGALIGPPSDDLHAVWRAEIAALDGGDLDAAVEVNLRAWVDGPNRPPEHIDPAIRAFVATMQRDAFELPEWDSDDAPETELSPPADARLAELDCWTLVVVGEADQPAIIDAAHRLAARVPAARLISWPDVAHMVNLERPAEFERAVLDFVDTVP
jgi:pimeloyl-ACP methyl ester carboxylesterase